MARLFDDLEVERFEAADGQTAVNLTAEVNPDLIILDVDLPVMDGFDVVELLRTGKFAGTRTMSGTAVFPAWMLPLTFEGLLSTNLFLSTFLSPLRRTADQMPQPRLTPDL